MQRHLPIAHQNQAVTRSMLRRSVRQDTERQPLMELRKISLKFRAKRHKWLSKTAASEIENRNIYSPIEIENRNIYSRTVLVKKEGKWMQIYTFSYSKHMASTRLIFQCFNEMRSFTTAARLIGCHDLYCPTCRCQSHSITRKLLLNRSPQNA